MNIYQPHEAESTVTAFGPCLPLPPSLPPVGRLYIRRSCRASAHFSLTYLHFLTECSCLCQQSLKIYTQGNITEFY